ncbi:aconitate hydratase [Puniceicoccus vermicola]|uniref:Aconitate hydratase A n=1 Tax=Puniceicoccus vermicola TaxID=388746 RepID=A0A7X1AVV6_9BACT|nr:aconitate hydratase [Puniceicoccus vermicola]MBC2600953.1 aconitate hydratase [Puniceicoccus vermicola]
MTNPFNSLQSFESGSSAGKFYSLPELEKQGVGPISRLPVSIRVVLESVLRNCDGERITEDDVKRLANWNAKSPAQEEIPFTVSRIVLQDFTGVPLLVDLAAMRDAAAKLGKEPSVIEPLVPVDLVVDHSVQVDRAGTAESFRQNLKFEFERNRERYEFLKWGQQAFDTFSVVPPAIGIVHQVNLEHLAKVVFEREVDGESVFYPDTLVGTDSHTTMINGLGVVGWGVGGIEAEAGMLGQPVYFLTPEVIGVNLTGVLKEGVTATDLTLRITEMLRQHKVVGKFIEFFGEGVEELTLADRATIANMAPEYGATMGFFPVDDQTLEYLRVTGRTDEQIALIKDYLTAQGLYGIPKKGDVEYTQVLDLDIGSVVPCTAGPKRPQDRIDIPALKQTFSDLLNKDASDGGFGKADDLDREVPIVPVSSDGEDISGGDNLSPAAQENGQSEMEMVTNRPAFPGHESTHTHKEQESLKHGSVVIAAITSCTNTSNPSVMLAAGLVAKRAVEKGLTVPDYVKSSLAPGSRVVTDYLEKTGLDEYLDKLGFQLVGYGCTTCIGNSGPLDDEIEAAVKKGDLVAASVLSGNRNFEARVHSSIKANFLMSPPLVVAFALAGRIDIDLDSDPIGNDSDGNPVYLKDLWPTQAEIKELISTGITPEMFREKYSEVANANEEWTKIESSTGDLYEWDEDSTYIQNPPFFEEFSPEPGTIEPISSMRPLAIFGDSVTTDHISPAGAIPEDGPAGKYLISKGVEKRFFNSFGSRRGNDRIMTRGTFANVRIKNLLAGGKEGGYTCVMPEKEETSIFEACEKYREENTPLIVIAGNDYGMGSSRDWAAKGTALLGVRAVVAQSYERIHRSNLIGMGVLPLQFKDGQNAESLSLDGTEVYSLPDLTNDLKPQTETTLVIERANGEVEKLPVLIRIDTGVEIDYYRHGGILPYVLRDLTR